MAEKFVQKANQEMEKKGTKGDFKAWVKNNMKGKDTCAAAASIMNMDEEARKKKYSAKVRKMANFAHNTCGMKKSGRTKGSANAMKGGPGGKGPFDKHNMKGDRPAKPTEADSGLTDKQKTLPPFLKEKIQKAKEKRAGKKEERQEKRAAKKEAKKK